MLGQVLALCHHLWDVGEKGVSMNASTGSTDNRNLTVGN